VDPIRDQLRLSWRTEGIRPLSSGWTESEAKESYHPPWMKSSYPEEADAQQSLPSQWPLSPFGKPWFNFP